MELKVKSFDELTVRELYEIYRLRCRVFVVEQNCVYQDVDDTDPVSEHVWYEKNGSIIAYLRIFRDAEDPAVVRIGRVISVERRNGNATRLLKAVIQLIQGMEGVDRIYLEAQCYARSLYEKTGFSQVTEEFLEDGIPHVGMQLIL